MEGGRDIEQENKFNRILRQLRKSKGITQEQLADAAGVSPQAVSKWEMSGYPDTQLLPVIADFLGVTIDELFGRKREDISIYEQVEKYIDAAPGKERIDRCYELSWAICCYAFYIRKQFVSLEDSTELGENVLSEAVTNQGYFQARLSGDLRYLLFLPEPEKGYDSKLAYDESYVELFRFLTIPNALRAMYYLENQGKNQFFNLETLKYELQIDEENAGRIIEGMEKLKFVRTAALNSGKQSEKIYQYDADCNFVSFMVFAYMLLNKSSNFLGQYQCRDAVFFRRDTYNKDV